MGSTTVYFIGGLGNQLHQLSVALGLAQYTRVRLSDALMGTQRKLGVLAAVGAAGFDVDHSSAPEIPPTRLRNIDLSRPPADLVTFPETVGWMGHVAQPALFASLIESLFPARQPSGNRTTVAHVRLGDYLWPPASRRYGVLSSAYYQAGLQRAEGSTVVTDDPVALARIHRRLMRENEIALNPVASVADDFHLMCTASGFIAANSTLSLWAAWYRTQAGLGADTYAPSSLYRIDPRSDIPGLGSQKPKYFTPAQLVIRHPWVLTRRISWQGRFW